ncbi:hypothetical protein HYC85_020771 [Camellia sinensis]|uniref:Poly(A) polymerase nucleotidyltransferase domain-containing protein n=1 Tax=Camellia sinensis TaxID=4442 RepID=A0A7J7GQR9_CAMSI|nr:hypothetical protein HYC85_020771 [Camellia sinensis]
MAYANQNQGVFVPYHQLIDLRSLNQPVTFVTGPPIALNFINPSNGTVLVPPKPTLVPSFGFALDPAFLFMADEGLVPSPEEEIRRKNAIEKLRQVHNSELDIDALCVGPCFATLAVVFLDLLSCEPCRRIFFVFLHNMLTSRTEVSEVHCVKDAKVPLMQFKLDGISFDLPYAQLKNVDILNPFFQSNIDEKSWRSLSGVHANKCILRLLPNMELLIKMSYENGWVGLSHSSAAFLLRSTTPEQQQRPPTRMLFRCGRFELWVTKIRRRKVHLQGPPFTVEAFKTKQQTGHPPASIASCCGENDVEAHPKAKVYRKKGVDYIDLFVAVHVSSAKSRCAPFRPPSLPLLPPTFGSSSPSMSSPTGIESDLNSDFETTVGKGETVTTLQYDEANFPNEK